MDKVQAEENIQVIREIMERSARYTHFSGLSGIIAGILALIGCAATYVITYHIHVYDQNYWYVGTWVAVLILAVSQDLCLAQRKAKRAGQTIFNPATYQVWKAVLPGVFFAFVVSVRVLLLDDPDAIPGIWTLGYGVAACAAGMFSVKEVRTFGIIQLITGAIGLVFFATWETCLYVLALSFGVYHILFGLWMSRKYGW